MLAMLPILLFTGCSSDDDDEINGYEKNLVGSWESDDSEDEILYLVLKSDKTGTFRVTYQGEPEGEDNLVWSATKNQLTFIIKGAGESYTYTYVLSGNHLYYDDVSYVRK